MMKQAKNLRILSRLKQSVLLGLIISMSTPALAWRFGGDDVGNGGGLAEQNVLMAFQHMEFYASLCLRTQACRLNQKETQILKDILTALPKELSRPDMIVFASEAKTPGTFLIDGEVKIARTGSGIGDPVYINSDLLYQKNTMNKFEALSLARAVALLIHELGHHVSKASHTELDLLGVKVSMSMEHRVQNTPVLPWSDEITMSVIQGPKAESFPQVLLGVGDGLWDLSKMFSAAVFCPVLTVPIPLLPFPDLQLGKKTPRGVVYHNVHWEKAEKDDLEGSYEVAGNLTHVCPSGTSNLSLVNSFRVRITFDTKKNGNTLELDPRSVRVKQTYEPWYKLVLFSF